MGDGIGDLIHFIDKARSAYRTATVMAIDSDNFMNILMHEDSRGPAVLVKNIHVLSPDVRVGMSSGGEVM